MSEALQNKKSNVKSVFLALQAVWFAILVFLSCVLLCILLPPFSVLPRIFSSENFLLSTITALSQFSLFLAWFVTLPTLVWTIFLVIFARKNRYLSPFGHAVAAFLASLLGGVLTIVVVVLGGMFIRAKIDARFDDLGYLAIFSMMGAASLTIIFPLLSIFLRALAIYLKIPKLFPIEPDQLSAS